ncbi:MAG TPA: aminotransferase class V-fold PLP-dependent enzyme [Bacteroidia bacterium]|nr:aminotransferase class V-fold PLP-dependent enzyme [Bacteroidia bacterium]
MYKTFLILGGDGYFGWPLSMRLAVSHPDSKIIIVDNQWRRNVVKTQGSDSIIPIASPEERIKAFQKIHGLNNIHYVNMDMNSPKLEELIKYEQPGIIYHLGQQCSAPYSMKGQEEALFTLINNEAGNMRLLWAVKKHTPDTHIIKLGSFGEYAQGGIDISEGYFQPEFKGKKATKPMPFPREADDIYHVSKINDTNYVAMACRKWGLRITDVMQSTIFGNVTDEMMDCPELYTRFDYDEAFGTVLNRFLAQVVVGYPLTVYGTGKQRTGLMCLKDSVNSLARLADEEPVAGEHKVINHVTLSNFSINELAESVRFIAGQEGYTVTIKHDAYDPRMERPDKKLEFGIHTDYIDESRIHSPFVDVIRQTLKLISTYKNRISLDVFPPVIQWAEDEKMKQRVLIKNERIVIEEEPKESTTDEAYWAKFRKENFHSRRINFNPGTLGTPSERVKHARIFSVKSDEIEAHPLGLYEYGRKCQDEIQTLTHEIWKAPGYYSMVVHGTSQTLNLVALSMLRVFHGEGKGPYRIITTEHEHVGGIGCFENIPEYEVHYLDDKTLEDKDALVKQIELIKPHLAFFSHVFYDTGSKAPAGEWARLFKKYAPNCKVIIDAAQSLGVIDLPFGDADVILGSAHKWLFGPHGGGLIWMKNSFKAWIQSLYWSGHGLIADADLESLSIPGGQDFMLYPAMLEALKLYQSVGKDVVFQRSAMLANWFQKKLADSLVSFKPDYVFLNNTLNSPVISLAFREFDPYPLYKSLNDRHIHVKCIKDHKIGNKIYHILRFGFPYFETLDRLEYAISQIKLVLAEIEQKELRFGT